MEPLSFIYEGEFYCKCRNQTLWDEAAETRPETLYGNGSKLTFGTRNKFYQVCISATRIYLHCSKLSNFTTKNQTANSRIEDKLKGEIWPHIAPNVRMENEGLLYDLESVLCSMKAMPKELNCISEENIPTKHTTITSIFVKYHLPLF